VERMNTFLNSSLVIYLALTIHVKTTLLRRLCMSEADGGKLKEESLTDEQVELNVQSQSGP